MKEVKYIHVIVNLIHVLKIVHSLINILTQKFINNILNFMIHILALIKKKIKRLLDLKLIMKKKNS